MKKLLIITQEHISALIKKGEVIERYYNPGNFFAEVHILLLNEDQPERSALQAMVGDAKLSVYNLPQPPHFFRNTLGWQFALMRPWSEKVVALARQIKPSAMRTYNNFLDGYLAAFVKKKLNISYLVSLHGLWDVDALSPWKEHLHRYFRKKIEVTALKNANSVICVYSPILDYANKKHANNPILLPNFVSSSAITPKKNRVLNKKIRLVTVNRLLPRKNPSNILRAIAKLPYNFDYTIIGDGILYEQLKQLAKELGIEDQVIFIQSLPNDKVCQILHDSDMLVIHCTYKGISKAVIEAGLTGLPIIVNRYNDGFELKEYQGGWLEQCEDSATGYAESIAKLIEDDDKRESLGKKAYETTLREFNPRHIEKMACQLYMDLTNSAIPDNQSRK